MLVASETWAPTLSDLYRLQRNNRAMIRCIRGATTKDHINYQDLLGRMLDDLAKVLHTHRLRWHGRVERSDG